MVCDKDTWVYGMGYENIIDKDEYCHRHGIKIESLDNNRVKLIWKSVVITDTFDNAFKAIKKFIEAE